MTLALLLLSLVTQADELVKVVNGPLRMQVPGVWSASMRDGASRYDAPSGNASFEVTAMPVSPPREAGQCLDQLLHALGSKGWQRTQVGGAPAARRVAKDVGSLDGGTLDLMTETYVGCNGHHKLVLTFTYEAQRAKRFEPLVGKIVSSVTYAK